MKERPILFSGPMVRGLLDGRKTQTRRVVKFPAWANAGEGVEFSGSDGAPAMLCAATGCFADVRSPYGLPGDRLWVRETWQHIYERRDGQCFTEAREGVQYKRRWIEYAATSEQPPPTWRPSIFMPRDVSRITLKITDVRVERLHDIKSADAAAEGWPGADDKHINPVSWYAELWDHINGKRVPWDLNPWVWVVRFENDVAGKPHG